MGILLIKMTVKNVILFAKHAKIKQQAVNLVTMEDSYQKHLVL